MSAAMSRTLVKICGLTNEVDAQLAEQLGADFLGFVFEPSSPRYVGSSDWSPEWLRELKAFKVAVFGPELHPVSDSFDFVQAHSWSELENCRRRQIHVVRVGDEETRGTVQGMEFMILDPYDREKHGGTGKLLDVELARQVIQRANVPVIIAGGLNPENVTRMLVELRPAGIDLSSGVESQPGKKDPDKLRALFDAVRSFDAKKSLA